MHLNTSNTCECRKCYYSPMDVENDIFSVVFFQSKFIVCNICGNKRCPHATDHELECTNSNEPGQRGSFYE